MTQPTLFDSDPLPRGIDLPPHHLARASDPVSSHEAAERHDRSGRRQANALVVLALVRLYPGRTGHEIWSLATEQQRAKLGTYHEAYRRLADLEAAGLIRRGPERKCSVKGTKMVTRWPMNTQEGAK